MKKIMSFMARFFKAKGSNQKLDLQRLQARQDVQDRIEEAKLKAYMTYGGF